MMNSFDELLHSGTQECALRGRLAVVRAEDDHILEALAPFIAEGRLAPVFIGKTEKIRPLLEKYGISESRVSLTEADSDGAAARAAMDLVNSGAADAVMKGRLQTAELLHAVVDRTYGIRCGGVMSHISFHEMPSYHKLFAITDSGMTLTPSHEEKLAILRNAVEVFHALGEPCPKVALLAAAETPNTKVPASMDALSIQTLWQAGGLPGCTVAGPLSYDLAMSPGAAAEKGYSGPVCGDADILLVPDMTAGNLLGKALVCSAGAKMAGLVLGARVPIILTSRGSGAEEKKLSVLMAARIQAGQRKRDNDR